MFRYEKFIWEERKKPRDCNKDNPKYNQSKLICYILIECSLEFQSFCRILHENGLDGLV